MSEVISLSINSISFILIRRQIVTWTLSFTTQTIPEYNACNEIKTLNICTSLDTSQHQGPPKKSHVSRSLAER